MKIATVTISMLTTAVVLVLGLNFLCRAVIADPEISRYVLELLGFGVGFGAGIVGRLWYEAWTER